MNHPYAYRHYDHQIRTIRCPPFNYTIAIPPITLKLEYINDFIGDITSLIHLGKNIYHKSSLLLNQSRVDPREGEDRIFEGFWTKKIFAEMAIPFEVNENLTIRNFQHWRDLTQQNPNFVREQYRTTPITPGKHDYLYCNRATCTAIPDWMFENREIIVARKISRPATRSIETSGVVSMKPEKLQLSLPQITLFHQKLDNSSPRGRTLCLTETGENSYIPFRLPNVDHLGRVCMGSSWTGRNKRDCPFDYFWNSTFTEPGDGERLVVNENLSIKSFKHWQYLTQQNPNFFQQQFNPIHAEKYSPILYRLENNSLSWEFNEVP